jgi:hypothetical protein
MSFGTPVSLRSRQPLCPVDFGSSSSAITLPGKDQIKPLNAVHKSRNCHVRFKLFLIVRLWSRPSLTDRPSYAIE